MNTHSKVSASAYSVENPNVEDIAISSEAVFIAQIQTMMRIIETMMMRNMKVMNN